MALDANAIGASPSRNAGWSTEPSDHVGPERARLGDAAVALDEPVGGERQQHDQRGERGSGGDGGSPAARGARWDEPEPEPREQHAHHRRCDELQRRQQRGAPVHQHDHVESGDDRRQPPERSPEPAKRSLGRKRDGQPGGPDHRAADTASWTVATPRDARVPGNEDTPVAGAFIQRSRHSAVSAPAATTSRRRTSSGAARAAASSNSDPPRLRPYDRGSTSRSVVRGRSRNVVSTAASQRGVESPNGPGRTARTACRGDEIARVPEAPDHERGGACPCERPLREPATRRPPTQEEGHSGQREDGRLGPDRQAGGEQRGCEQRRAPSGGRRERRRGHEPRKRRQVGVGLRHLLHHRRDRQKRGRRESRQAPRRPTARRPPQAASPSSAQAERWP